MIPFVDKDLENLTGIIQVYINRRLRLRQHHFDSTHSPAAKMRHCTSGLQAGQRSMSGRWRIELSRKTSRVVDRSEGSSGCIIVQYCVVDGWSRIKDPSPFPKMSRSRCDVASSAWEDCEQPHLSLVCPCLPQRQKVPEFVHASKPWPRLT